ncbi:MAG: hypothetical protein V4685_10265 [Bacteroidota bacterium]
MRKNIFCQFIIGTAAMLQVTSCNSQNKTTPGKSNPDSKKAASGEYAEGKDYTEFTRARILDKVGFNQPVEAFSLLLPKNWKVDGNVIWNQPGTTCAGNNQSVKASSPDGKYSFEMLPNDMWGYNTDPQMDQFNRSQPMVKYCWYGQPMNAEAYYKNVFAPNELGNPQLISINENPGGVNAMEESNNKTRQELMRYGASQVNFTPSAVYAKVKWSNGQEGIVLCAVNIITTNVPNTYTGTSTTIYTSIATERVVLKYPASESSKAANLISMIMSSVRTNTAWKSSVDNFWLSVRQQKQIAHIGKIKMMDEQTRQMGENAIKKGQQNLNAMDANMRNWEASQQSQDRIHTNFVKAIREVETYKDETGRIELSSGYNHAWSRSDGGSFIMSDNPNFDPSSVFQDQQWKEMKKVE